MFCIDSLGIERSLRLWRYVLAGRAHRQLAVDRVRASGGASAGRADPGLVGDWRGLYFHKNIAGAVSAITAIVFFFSAAEDAALERHRALPAGRGFRGHDAFPNLARLLPAGRRGGLTYRLAWRSRQDRSIVAVACVLALFLAAAFVAIDAEAISRMLEDPTEFTGRAAIWQAELAFAAIICSWAPASAPSPTPAACRRCTITSRDRGSRRWRTAIAATCRSSSLSAASDFCSLPSR